MGQEPPISNDETNNVASIEVDSIYKNRFKENKTLSPTKREKTIYRKRFLAESFKKNYNSSTFDYERKEKSKNLNFPNLNLSFLRNALGILLYILLGAIITLVIYLTIKNFKPQYKNNKNNIKKYNIKKERSNLKQIDKNNFEQLIKEAKTEKNYTLAIRYYYLWTLQKLNNKKLITWHKDKTDYEYYLQLEQNQIQTPFSNCLYIYNYIWYGKYPVNNKEFLIAEKIFSQFLHKI